MPKLNPKHLQRRPRWLPPIACDYLASLAPTHRPTTCGGYTATLRRFHAWLNDNRLDVARLTRQHITRWFQSMHAERLVPATRHGILMETRVYLRWLNERRPMRTAPHDLIRR